jgi:hypothetical protein
MKDNAEFMLRKENEQVCKLKMRRKIGGVGGKNKKKGRKRENKQK